MYEDIPKTQSSPIAILTPINNKQYTLNNIPFEPPQNSPPSIWKMRLNKRIGESPIRKIMNQS